MMYFEVLKKLVKSILHQLGFDIVRYPAIKPKVEPLIQRPFNVLEFIVAEFVSRNQLFFFIQVGANNGIRWDPLHKLICKHHLSGLLVEPLPDIFDELRRNYAMEPQLSFENSAIAEENGVQSLFRVKPDAPIGDWAHGVASFNKMHVINHLKNELEEWEQFIEEVKIPTISVTTLLQKHSITDITLLQIDTEGYDFEILKMFLGARMFPAVINFERAHLSFRDQQESRRLLLENGYRFLDVGIDTLAIRGRLSNPSEPEN